MTTKQLKRQVITAMGVAMCAFSLRSALVTDVPSGYLNDLTQPQGNAVTKFIGSSATNSGDYGPNNLFDNKSGADTSRWLATFDAKPTYFTYGFTTPTVVNAVRLRVPAYNCDKRAPKTWKVYGSNDNASWGDPLHAETDETGTWASQSARVYAFANSTPYAYYKIVVEAVRDPSDGWVQLSEVEFFDLTQIAASATLASVASDAVTFATTITRAGYGDRATVSVAVGTGSDPQPGAETVLATDLADGTVMNLTLAGLSSETDYAYWLYVRNEAGVTNVFTGSFRTQAAVPDVYLAQDLTSPNGFPPTASITGSDYLAPSQNMTFEWNHLFDNEPVSDNSRCVLTSIAGAYVTYEFEQPTCVNGYALTVPDYSVGEAGDRSPTAWTLEGSNTNEDGSWTTLHEGATTAAWRKRERRVWTFDNAVAYKFYRLSFSATADSAGKDDRVQLAEVEFFDLTHPRLTVLGDATGATGYELSLSLGLPGVNTATCDVLFACGADAANLPDEETLGEDVTEGWSFVKTLADLAETTTYFYRVRAVNDQGVETVVSGSFTTGKAEGVWNGSGETNTWSLAENWDEGSIPRNGKATFALAAGGATDVDAAFPLLNLFIDAAAGAFVHGGTGPLAVRETVTNLASATQTFAVPMALGATDGAFEVNVGTGGLLETTGKVETAVNALVKTGAGTWSVTDGAVLGAQNVTVEEGTLRIAVRDGHEGERYSRYTVGTVAPGTLVWRKTRLADVVSVTGLSCGSSLPCELSYTAFHWRNDGTTASVQLQVLDVATVKVVCLNLEQIGEDVYAVNWRAAYDNDRTQFGADFSTGHTSQYQASSRTANGYGVYCLRPVFAGDLAVGTGTITVKDGARLDVATPPGTTSLDQNEATHGKTVYVAGSGPDGAGALYNSDVREGVGSYNFGHVVLTGDTVAGGGSQSIRTLDGSAVRNPVLEGSSTFTVNNREFIFMNTRFALDRLDVATMATLQRYGQGGQLSGTITNGIHVQSATGAALRLIDVDIPSTMPTTVEPGGTATFLVTGRAQFDAPLTVQEGARLEISEDVGLNYGPQMTFGGCVTNNGAVCRNQGVAGELHFNSPIAGSGDWTFEADDTVSFGSSFDCSDYTGSFNISRGTLRIGDLTYGCATTLPPIGQMEAYIQVIADGPRAMGGEYDEVIRKSAVAKKDVYVISKTFPSELTLTDATWDVYKLFLGTANYPGFFTIGAGATVNVSNAYEQAFSQKSPSTAVTVAEGGALNFYGTGSQGFLVGYNGDAGLGSTYSHVFTVAGGTVTSSNAELTVGFSSNRVRVELDEGAMDVKGLIVRNASTVIRPDERYERFVQRGGVLSLGSSGITTRLYKDNGLYLNLAGGTLRATDSFANTFGILTTIFGETAADAGDYTIDLNGKTVAWNNALAGLSAVTVTGAGAFTSPGEVQGRADGKWRVATEPDATVDLSGAAAFAGGLELADGASATVAIGSETAIEFGYVPHDNTGIARPAAVEADYPFLATDMKVLGEKRTTDDPAAHLLGNMWYRCWRGKFYVAEDATWHFAANYKQYLRLTIDDEDLIDLQYADAGSVVCTGSKALTAGWHDFRVIAYAEGTTGPQVADWAAAKMAIGWSVDAAAEGSVRAADYARFDTDTLVMRPRKTQVRVQQGAFNFDTWNGDSCAYTAEQTWDSLQKFRAYGDFDKLLMDKNSRLSGCFYVAAGGAHQFQTWTAANTAVALWIDGEQIHVKSGEATETSPSVDLATGWHRYEIRVYAYRQAPHSGFIKVKRPGDAEFVSFDEEYLPLAAPTAVAGVEGALKIGAGAQLANAALGPCPIRGALEGSGALKGAFAFAPGGVLRLEANERALTRAVDVSGVTNPGAFWRSLKKIEFTCTDERSNRARYELGPAGDLTDAEAAAIAVSATQAGQPQAGWTVQVKSGKLSLVNPKPAGMLIIFR